jgi:hypothetical protein
MNPNPSVDRQRRRELLTAEIIEQVRAAVLEELADAPASWSRAQFEEIEQSVLAHTRLVVDALGFEEMKSEGAKLSHIANARWETQRLIRERRAASDAGRTAERETKGL